MSYLCCRRCQLDIQDKAEIIRQLNCTIEEMSCRLHERVARVKFNDFCMPFIEYIHFTTMDSDLRSFSEKILLLIAELPV